MEIWRIIDTFGKVNIRIIFFIFIYSCYYIITYLIIIDTKFNRQMITSEKKNVQGIFSFDWTVKKMLVLSNIDNGWYFFYKHYTTKVNNDTSMAHQHYTSVFLSICRKLTFGHISIQ